MKTAVIYCHTSRGSDSSIDAQEDRCRRMARRRGAEEIVAVIDRSPCPRARERQGIAQMLRLVHSGAVALVVVDEAGRLSRRLPEMRAICREVSRAGAHLIFIS